MLPHRRRVAALLAVALLPTVAAAQNVSPSLPWDTGGPVYAVARAGNVAYVGGDFTALSPRSQTIGAFGSFIFNPGRRFCQIPPISGRVHAVIADQQGGWFIGGRFDRVGTVDRQNLVHILNNCQIDTAFTGMVRGHVNALVLVSGTLFVGGLFSQAGQQGGGVVARTNLAAFAVSGGSLVPWNPGADGEVFALRGASFFQTTSQIHIYVGGVFTTLGGQPRQRLGAVDGNALATSFMADADGPVYALELEPPTSFSTPVRVYAGGEFRTIGGQPRDRVAAVTIATNTVESGFNPGANAAVRALIFAGTTLYAGGDFTQFGGVARNYLASVSSGGAALPFDPNMDGPVYALAVDTQSLATLQALYVGGRFARVGSVSRLHAARFSLSTGTPVLSDWNPAFNGVVRGLAVAPANIGGVNLPQRVGIGGEFNGIAAERRSNLAAINLDTGQLLAWNPVVNGQVNAIALRDGVIYIGGAFTRVDGQSRSRLAAFLAGTRALAAWNPSADGTVHALRTNGDTIYAGGEFTTIGGTSRGGVAGIHVSTGALTALTPPLFAGPVFTLVRDGSFLYVGGSFTTVGGAPATHLVRLDSSTGARDLTWTPVFNGEVRALCVASGAVYAGGAFTSAGGAVRANLAALDVTTGVATAWSPDPNGAVNALACSGQAIWAGGAFTTVGTATSQQSRPRLAALVPTAIGPTATYATAFRARLIGIVQDLHRASDGLLAGADSESSTEEDDAVARAAFFAEHFSGTPAPPLNAVASVFSGVVRIRWSPPVRGPRPTAYLLEAGSAPGLNDIAGGFRTTALHVEAPAPPGTYYVRIRSIGDQGTSKPSDELTFVISGQCTAPPDPPKDLSVQVSGNTVRLSWTPASGDTVTSYRLEAGGAARASTFVFALPVTETSFSADAPNGVFYARLRAVGPCGVSGSSSEVVLATGGLALPPSPPRNVMATVTASRTVTLSWTEPGSGIAESYLLEAGTSPGVNDIAVFPTRQSTLSFNNVPPGTYYLRVFAIGPTGISEPSEEIFLVVP